MPRLPGTAGSGPAITSGVNDTVILERPSANITVTLSSGTYNIRKLYMRETLNITGGSLTINYDPLYNFNVGRDRLAAVGTDFGAVLRRRLDERQRGFDRSSSASGCEPDVHARGRHAHVQQDQPSVERENSRVGRRDDEPVNNSNPRYTSHTATITGASASVDLGGGTRIFTIGNLADDVDVDVSAPIINGGLTKNGAGTMRLSGANTFSGPVTVNAGVLRSNNAAGFSSSSAITVNNGGTLDMNGITDTVASLAQAPAAL